MLGSELQAKQAIESVGVAVESIFFIPEGRSHNNFVVTSSDGSLMIARFEKPESAALGQPRRDSHFNGPVSLQREANLMDLLREGGLPAPRVYETHLSEQNPFLLVEKMPGKYWDKYLEEANFSLAAYLGSLIFLGSDLAKAHRIHFDSFGDVIAKDVVHPGGVHNFAERVRMISELKLHRAAEKKVLTTQDLDRVVGHFKEEFAALDQLSTGSPQQPVLTLVDVHPRNFFVDQASGRPSGFFDLEFCQAALPTLDLYTLRPNLINFFTGEAAERAEQAFLEGYERGKGEHNFKSPTSQKLEYILTIGYLLSAVTSYDKASDSVRATWSSKFRQIMFRAINSGTVDYQAIAAVLRTKTGQPKLPS